MVLPLALMLMAAGAKNRYDEAQQEKADREDERAYTREKRDRERQQWQREDQLRTDMQDAMAPVTVKRDQQLQGPTMEGAAPLPTVAKVAGASGASTAYKTPEEADASAGAINAQTPVARMSDVLAKNGQPMQAMQLRTADRQEQLGKIELDDAQQKHLDSMWDRSVNAATDFGSFANTVGAGKLRPVVSPDGKKVTLSTVNPDGSLTSTEHVYDNNDAGLTKAKVDAARLITPVQKMMILHQQAQQDQAAAQLAETTRHNQAVEKNQGDLTAAKIEMAGMRVAAAKAAADAKAAASAPAVETPESTFDRKTAASIAADTVKKEAEAAAMGGKPMSGADMARRQDEIVGAMFQQHTNRFIQTVAQRDLAAAQADPAAYAVAYAKASKLMPPAALAKMGFNPPAQAKPAPVAKPAAQPVASMQQATAPAPAAPAPAPVDPMAAKYAQETMELNAGNRLKLSPDVQAYQDQLRAAKAAQVQAASDATRADELARAKKKSKELAGVR